MSDTGTTTARSVRIISIISGKGGVGKTVVAFNLAERLAAAGARVLLVDADLNCGNVHILANTTVTYGLHEVIRGELSVSEAAVSSEFGFDILAAGGGGDVWTEQDVTSVAGVMAGLRKLSTSYDFILVDNSSGVSKIADLITHASDTALLVLIPELTSISDCYGLYKHLTSSDSAVDCRLLVNRAESADEAEYIRKKLWAVSERFLRRTPGYLGHISEDRALRESVASQTALARLSTESTAVQQVTFLARSLLRVFGWLSEQEHNYPRNTQKTINKTTAMADIRE
ncbi:MAG: AAA family ATPase [Candidatus Zixiibacteriota bacterium]|nr:MAG: AAA family ATPase [candidate division Zixibacteria bacterium]